MHELQQTPNQTERRKSKIKSTSKKDNTNLKEDDIVLCTVKRVEGTTVFLEIENFPGVQATMIFSEVSPGRIRNIRDYIAIKKKIVCKVLLIRNEHPELSLRRVTSKEREEILDHHKKEKILENIIKPVLKDKTQSILQKIKEKYELSDFLDEARENPKLIEKFVAKSHAPELIKIFSEKREKEKEVKQIIKLTSQSSSGLKDIKKTLDNEEAKIYYLGSSKFSVSVKAKDYKIANFQIEKILEEIKQKAKKLNVTLEIKEK